MLVMINLKKAKKLVQEYFKTYPESKTFCKRNARDAVLGLSYGKGQDTYQKLADEFGITRQAVKEAGMHVMYSISYTGVPFEETLRNHLKVIYKQRKSQI